MPDIFTKLRLNFQFKNKITHRGLKKKKLYKSSNAFKISYVLPPTSFSICFICWIFQNLGEKIKEMELVSVWTRNMRNISFSFGLNMYTVLHM